MTRPRPVSTSNSPFNSRSLLAACILVLPALSIIARPAGAALIVRNWVAGGDSTWNVNENWAPWGVPHNAGASEYHAFIDNGMIVSVDAYTVITALSLTNSSQVWIGNGEALWFWAATTEPGGAVANNQGTIRLYAEGSATRLYVNGGPMEFSSTEGGEVVFEAGTGSGFSQISGGGRVVNNDGHTFRGAGSFFGLSITNHSLITADDPTKALRIQPPSMTIGDVTNDGTLRAENGATLRLERYAPSLEVQYFNTGGVIEALDGSVVEFDGHSRYVGGELRTVGSGVIHCTSDDSLLKDLTIDGDLRIDHEVRTMIVGQIVNNGTILLDSVAPGRSYVGLTSEGDCTLSGTGTLDLGDNDNWVMAFSGGRLTNGAGHTIVGGGSLGRNLLPITNQGIIDAASDVAAMNIDPPSPGDFTNEGTLQVTGTAGMTIHPGTFTTIGQVIVNAGGALTRNGTYQQDGGATTVNGTLTVTSGSLALAGGTLDGSGTIVATVDNAAGSVEPGTSPGLLSVTGSYTQGAGGSMRIELAGIDPGTGHDQLVVSGNVTLDGALDVVLLGGYEPDPADVFTIVTSGTSVSGVFSQVQAPGFTVSYLPAAVVLSDFQPCHADCAAPASGTVDVNDLLSLLAEWGGPGSCDTDDSGVVDVTDLLEVLAKWGGC